MGIRDRFSRFLVRQVEKRGLIEDSIGGSVRLNGWFADDENILHSSDVYELLQDISNQITLAQVVVEDQDTGKDITNHPILKVLRNPNKYLTGTEFMKLMVNTYLVEGEVFPFYTGKEIHIVSNVDAELDSNLEERFKINGTEIPSKMIRHIKNIGLNHLTGVGLKQLGKDTLEGVMSAEKVLTDKYKKGGILAFLLKLDAHINPKNGAQSILINSILDQLEGIDESRTIKLIPLGKGYEIDELKSPIDDAKILSYLNVYKKDLGKFLNIDVETYRAMLKTDLEKAMMYLHNKSVKSIMQNFEDHLSLLFFGPNSNLRLKFKINILDFVPYSTKTNIAYNLVRTMVATPDDARDGLLGFDRLFTEESMKLYISKDLIAGEDINKATDNSLKGGDEGGQAKGDSDT
ncbi:portal protein [Lysinibacillus sp. KCTC 33748]|uniref:phage portal protein n=1 Tax=unclassified Lysinibacillus TaxID=2636778 RepID=UPI0009A907E6|nr:MULTISPECIES: phage portal protein [unclassified Lysinibacillus]OXS67513.1 portal protein [Lysinibacillus sp. KCTC 33748]SKC14370.1 phage portal protein, HK97 family [Lysinibacillus sp. AC-3]